MNVHCQVCEKKIPKGKDVCPDCVADPVPLEVKCIYCGGVMAVTDSDALVEVMAYLFGGAALLVTAGMTLFLAVPGIIKHSKDAGWVGAFFLGLIAIYYMGRVFKSAGRKGRHTCGNCGHSFERK